jgi:hypothetical protein
VASSDVAIAVDPARNFLYYVGTLFGNSYSLFERVLLTNPATSFHVDNQVREPFVILVLTKYSQYADAIAIGANGAVLIETGGTITTYAYNGGNSYSSSSHTFGDIQYFNTLGMGVAANGDIYYTCYNCGANNKNSYSVFKYATDGTITTTQNGDDGGNEGPWGGG